MRERDRHVRLPTISSCVLLATLGGIARADDRPPEAIVICDAEGCQAIAPASTGSISLCFRGLEPPTSRTNSKRGRAAAPKLVDDRGSRRPLSWNRDRHVWCAVVDARDQLKLVDGQRERKVSMLSLSVSSSAAGGSTQWEEIKPPSHAGGSTQREQIEIRRSEAMVGEPIEAGTMVGESIVQSYERHLLTLLAERAELVETVEADDGRNDTPDDRAFLDVVAVGTDVPHCTGIAIAKDAVLTAAHCLPATRVSVALRTEHILRSASVASSHTHPELDLAVLLLSEPLPVVTRARRRATDSRPPQGLVRAIGFGVSDPKDGSGFGVKRRADIPVFKWGCDAPRSATSGCRPDAEMVVPAVGGRDTCLGDSGGPLLEPLGDTWRLIAITSRPAPRSGALCGRAGIYVRVDVVDGWLTHILEAR